MVTDSAPNPYAPPTTDEAIDETFLPTDYRPSAILATALKWSLGVTTVITAAQLVSTWMQMELLSRARDGAMTAAEAEANDVRVQILAVAYLVSLLVSAVLWCIWQNRTNKNARALGAENLEYGPNAWGWFACPVLNLWRPLQAVRELWLVADHRSLNMTPPDAFTLWWGGWVIGSIASRIGGKMAEDSDDIDLLINSGWVDMLGGVGLVAAGVGAILVVRAISGREQAGYARHHGGAAQARS